jgi:hypothetical protein
MALALLLAFQAAAAPAPAPPAPPALATIDFDLARYRPAEPGGCERGAEAIIVCGRRRGNGAYPMPEMERRFAFHPFVAETGLAGTTTANIHSEAVAMDRGLVSNRIMVGIKLPF